MSLAIQTATTLTLTDGTAAVTDTIALYKLRRHKITTSENLFDPIPEKQSLAVNTKASQHTCSKNIAILPSFTHQKAFIVAVVSSEIDQNGKLMYFRQNNNTQGVKKRQFQKAQHFGNAIFSAGNPFILVLSPLNFTHKGSLYRSGGMQPIMDVFFTW